MFLGSDAVLDRVTQAREAMTRAEDEYAIAVAEAYEQRPGHWGPTDIAELLGMSRVELLTTLGRAGKARGRRVPAPAL